MPETVFPVTLYEELLPKLVDVLELTQKTDGIANPQSKQKLLQATNTFKNAIAQAKEFSNNLRGGELTIEEQDDVIQLLETLRERKRAQLRDFASRTATTKTTGMLMDMELDSVASTPASS
ncbi:hypothetical protein CPB83DRAFT_892381 [Crepidotus variabilis]|uniref:Mediator of RNA polymerase II transcription subunit 9 n=1 Tax=Crepidotus variabilis TaxID=179855 RepID=A0A9P6EJA6_9AGAR|nr:hypothetical protein CPB83DRAFT_892381 [Crepidotus variabilis]